MTKLVEEVQNEKGKEKKITITNPATEEVLNEYQIISNEKINAAAKKAKNAFYEWKDNINKRIDFIHDFAKELRKNNNKEETSVTATISENIL